MTEQICAGIMVGNRELAGQLGSCCGAKERHWLRAQARLWALRTLAMSEVRSKNSLCLFGSSAVARS